MREGKTAARNALIKAELTKIEAKLDKKTRGRSRRRSKSARGKGGKTKSKSRSATPKGRKKSRGPGGRRGRSASAKPKRKASASTSRSSRTSRTSRTTSRPSNDRVDQTTPKLPYKMKSTIQATGRKHTPSQSVVTIRNSMDGRSFGQTCVAWCQQKARIQHMPFSGCLK